MSISAGRYSHICDMEVRLLEHRRDARSELFTFDFAKKRSRRRLNGTKTKQSLAPHSSNIVSETRLIPPAAEASASTPSIPGSVTSQTKSKKRKLTEKQNFSPEVPASKKEESYHLAIRRHVSQTVVFQDLSLESVESPPKKEKASATKSKAKTPSTSMEKVSAIQSRESSLWLPSSSEQRIGNGSVLKEVHSNQVIINRRTDNAAKIFTTNQNVPKDHVSLIIDQRADYELLENANSYVALKKSQTKVPAEFVNLDLDIFSDKDEEFEGVRIANFEFSDNADVGYLQIKKGTVRPLELLKSGITLWMLRGEVTLKTVTDFVELDDGTRLLNERQLTPGEGAYVPEHTCFTLENWQAHDALVGYRTNIDCDKDDSNDL